MSKDDDRLVVVNVTTLVVAPRSALREVLAEIREGTKLPIPDNLTPESGPRMLVQGVRNGRPSGVSVSVQLAPDDAGAEALFEGPDAPVRH